MILLGSTPSDWTSWISVCEETIAKREEPQGPFHRAALGWKGTMAYFACTVEASSQRRQRPQDGRAVVAFDSVERSDAGQRPHPSHVLLQHVSQVADVEGISVILPWRQTPTLVQHKPGQTIAFNNVHSTFTVMDDSLIFCSTISLAEKPSSRNVNSNAVFMVAQSPLDWSPRRGRRAHSDYWKLFSSSQFNVETQTKAPTRKETWCRVVPQEYKVQGGSPVKLKPFKYDSRPGPAR